MRWLGSTMRLVGAFALVVAWLVPASASAQAWIHDPGDGYVELRYRTISGDRFYNSDGDTQLIRSTYTQRTVGLYAEVGVVPRWLQVVVDGELFRYNELEDQGATYGLGDTGIGVWTGLLQDDVKLSAGVRVGLPTGDPEPDAPGDDPQADIIAASLPTGDGIFDVTGSVALGYGHAWASGTQMYATATGGYELRFERQRDALRWRAEVGFRFPPVVLNSIWWSLRLRGLHPLGDGGRSSFSGLSAGSSYVATGLTVSAELYRGFGVRGAFEGAIFARNVVAAPSFSVGIYSDF